MRRKPTVIAAWVALAALGACSPALDWREFDPEGSGLTVAFPCRPDHHTRTVRLVGAAVKMNMLVCAASDMTFAVAYLDVSDPAGVSAALSELRAAAKANVGGGEGTANAASVPGMTPNPQAARLRLAGRRPDGAPLQEQAVFFAKGLRVYQATVVGTTLPEEPPDTFFSGLKLPS